jgi:hypothetical protein
MTARTLPGRVSTRCLSSCRVVASVVSDVERWGLDQSQRSNSSHRCSVEVRSGLWAGQSISGTVLSTNNSLTDNDLWQAALSCWYRQSSSLNWSSTVDSMQQVKIILYPSAFTFPCSITRGPSPFLEKHPHTVMPSPPDFTVGITYAGRYHSPGICHTQTLPLEHHMVECDSSLQITHFQLSIVQWRHPYTTSGNA